MDKLSPERRSANMSRIKSTDTKPEMLVRRTAHRLGYRFRLHRKDLPGKPDLVFVSRKAIVEVHGCFWHRHPGCRRASLPATRPDYWQAKFDRNVSRDAARKAELEATGWRVLVVWECSTTNEAHLACWLQAHFPNGDHSAGR